MMTAGIQLDFRESLQSLRSNPLRSALSILGVVFGVGSVVAMLSVGLGAEKEIESLLQSLGTQNLHVVSKDLSDDEWRRAVGSTVGLAKRDEAVLGRVYAGHEVAAVGKWATADVNKSLTETRLTIYGVTASFRRVVGLRLAAGRGFGEIEEQRAFPVALVGEDLAREWFGADPNAAVGELVRINRSWFKVIGVLGGRGPEKGKTKGKGEMPGVGGSSGGGTEMKLLGLNRAVVMPLFSAQTRLGPLPRLSTLERLVVKLDDAADPIAERRRLESLFKHLHRGKKVVDVTSADEVIEQKKATSRLFSYFLLTIALISLVVGGIGIANVMLASMVERIREVGLRRAIGAKRRHILGQFLSESLCICLIGGVVGGVVGMAIAGLIGLITGWSMVFPWWGLIVALLIATIVGIVSGLYPALLASRISPIEALQGRA